MRFLRQTLLSVCLILPCAIGIAQPNAQNDSYSIQEDAAPTPYDILFNDSDPTFGIDLSTVDLEPATPAVDQGPINTVQGTFTVDGAGNLTFAPIADFNGTVVRQYTVKNNESPTPQTSNEATVSVTVLPVNDPPTIGTISPITIAEDAMGGTGELTLPIGDIDTPLPSLSLSGVSDNTALVDAGAIVFSDDKVTITPLANQFGTANITIEVKDDEDETDSEVLVLTVTSVNDAPVALDDSRSTNEDTDVTWAVVANDSDIDGTITSVDLNPTALGIQSTFSNTAGLWNVASGDITYDPALNYTGPASLTYVAIDNDNSASNVATVSVTINSINDPPVINPIPSVTIDENTIAGPITLVVSDVETPLASLILTPSTNNTTLVPLSGIAFNGNDVTITPQANQFGTADITIEVKDEDGGTDSEILALTVTAVDAPPIMDPISPVTIVEDAGISGPYTLSATDPDTPVGSLTYSLTSNSNPTLIPPGGIVITGDEITLTPALNQFGTANLTIQVDDGSGGIDSEVLVLTVTALNDPPIMNTISPVTILEDAGASGPYTLSATDIDTPVGSLTFSLTANSNPTLIPPGGIIITGNQLTLTPAANQFGTANLTIQVNDGSGGIDSEVLVLTVTSQNDLPIMNTISPVTIAEDAGASGPYTLSATDLETPVGSLTFSLTANSNPTLIPPGGIIITGNQLTLTPAANLFGTANLTIQVNDGSGGTDSEVLVLTVTSQNDLPIMNTISPVTRLEDAGAAGPFTLSATDLETPVGSLAFSLTANSNPTLIPPGGIVISGNQITLTPAANQFGTANLTIQVNDGNGGTDSEILVLTVTGVNDPPIMNTISPVTILEDAGASGPYTLSAADIDTPVGSLTYSLITNSNPTLIPPGGIIISGNQITLTPAANQFGTANLTIQVNDGSGGIDSEILVLTVTSQNDLPIMNTISPVTIVEDAGTSGPYTLSATDLETPVGSLTYSLTTNSNPTLIPPGGIVISGNQITLTPAANLFGTANLTIQVNDGNGGTDSEILVMTVTGVNDPPIMNTISPVTIAEDAGASGPYTLPATDLETPVGSLTFSVTANSNPTLIPPGGIVITGNQLTLTPAANQFGTANLTIQVNDGSGGIDSEVLVLTVTSQNDLPIMNTISPVTIAEDAGASGPYTLSATDLETPVGSLTYSLTTNSNPTLIPPGGIIISGNQLTLTPAANQFGTANLTLQVNDGSGGTDSEILVLTVTGVNDPPIMNTISPVTIAEDAGASGPYTLSATDPDTPAGSLTYSLTTNSNPTLIPPGGIVISGNQITLTPAANQFGTANLTIQVNDGSGGIDSEVLVLTVTSQNDLPIMNTISPVTIAEDAGASGPYTLSATDLETPVALLAYSLTTNSNPTLIPPGGIVISGNQITLTPAANQFGTANLTIQVNDGSGGTDSEILVLTVTGVNDPPIMNTISPVTIAEDAGASGPYTLSATDLETTVGSLTFSVTSNSNPTLIPPGGIVITGNQITLTPAPNQSGTANLTIQVNDGSGGTDSEILLLTVTSENDPPVAVNDNATTAEDTPVSRDVKLNDTDPDGTIVSVDLDPGTPGVQTTFTNGAGTWNIVAGEVRYSPLLNYTGPASVSYVVVDNDNASSNVATFTVAITPVNDPPTITPIGNQATNEDTPTAALTFTVSDIDTPVGSLSVTGTSNATTVIPDANIVISGTGATRTVTLTPAPEQNGLAVITLTVYDGTTYVPMSFAVTVTPVSDPPTITTIPNQLIDEDANTGPLPFTIADIDNPVGSLTITRGSNNLTLVPISNIVIGGSGANQTVTVTPAADQTGIAVITITVSDGTTSVPTTFQVTVDGFNDPPTISSIANQSTSEDIPTAAIPFTVGDPETPAADLTVTASSDNVGIIPNANIVIVGTGANRTVQVTPEANQSGAAIITLTVSDGVNSTPTTFQVTVNTVNDPPTITTIPNQTINEDAQTAALPFTINDVETAIPSLTLTTSSNNVALVPLANITLAGSGANHTVQVTPLANQFGTAVITVSVNDGGNITSTTFQLTVTAVNDLPTITAITDQTINEDTPTTALAFTITDIETPLASLTVTGTSDNTALVPVANIVFAGSGGNRTVTVTPAANQTGVATITLALSDGTANVPTTFQVTVNPVNDAPVITGQTVVSTNEEQPLDIEFSDLVVTDVDNAFPAGFTLTVLSNPGYSVVGHTITPNNNVTGNITVRVQVNDGALSSNIYNLQVTVNPINDPPVITGQSTLTILEDNALTFLISHLTIVDPDNASGFTFTLGAGSNYSVSAGNIITPSAHFNGTLSVPVTVSDGGTTSAPYNVQIQVTAVNDKPQITGQTPISIAEVQPVAIDLSQLTVFDPDNAYPTDFELNVLSGPNYTIVGDVVTPVVNFSGTLLVRLFVSDGALNSDVYNFQILVNSTNDPPVITGQRPLNTEENEPIEIQFVDLIVSDPDNTYPTGFTLTILPGSNYTFSGTTVTPNPNVSGLIDVRVKVNDGAVDSAPYPLKIDVNSVNDAPAITGQLPMTTLEDTPINMSMGFLIISDPDSPISGFTMEISPGANYTLTGVEIKPVANFNGTLSVPVTVNDGSLNSQPYNVQIQVTPANDAPVITGQNPLSTLEDQPITLKLADFLVTDIDNTFPTGFTLQVAQGSFANYDVVGTTVTPKPNFNGTLGVTMTISDGVATSNSYPAAIVVNSINDPPTLDPVSNVTVPEDPTEASVISLTGITAGVGEGTQSVVVTISTANPELIEVLEVTYTGGTIATVRIKPKADKFGTAQITIRIQDDGASSSPNISFLEYSFEFTIDPLNDAPTFTSEPKELAETAQAFQYDVVVKDVEQEVITITAPTLPSWLVLTQTSNGLATLSGIPPVGTTGEAAVVIVASDPAGLQSTQEFSIVVNARPTITPFAISTNEDVKYEFTTEFAANYNDADGNAIANLQIKQLPTKGRLLLGDNPVILNAEIPAIEIAKLNYRPFLDSNGTDIIKWNASDGVYNSILDANIVVSIIPFNDPPEITALEAPELDTLKYELGSEVPVKLTKIFDARDPEGDNIIAAEIGFQVSTEYRVGQDIFSFKDTLGIVGAFIKELGVLTLTGKAPVQDYVAAIRTVRYNYLDATPKDVSNRKVSIRLNDGAFGGTKERLVGLVYTNPGLDIANAFTPNGDEENKYWKIYSPAGLERYKDALIRVYDKRGVLVYEATGFSTPWYGEGPNGALPSDSYYYTIDLRYDKKKYKGVVTILR